MYPSSFYPYGLLNLHTVVLPLCKRSKQCHAYSETIKKFMYIFYTHVFSLNSAVAVLMSLLTVCSHVGGLSVPTSHERGYDASSPGTANASAWWLPEYVRKLCLQETFRANRLEEDRCVKQHVQRM